MKSHWETPRQVAAAPLRIDLPRQGRERDDRRAPAKELRQ
jgi:hypothetical protein